jgi:hypothetical protein
MRAHQPCRPFPRRCLLPVRAWAILPREHLERRRSGSPSLPYSSWPQCQTSDAFCVNASVNSLILSSWLGVMAWQVVANMCPAGSFCASPSTIQLCPAGSVCGSGSSDATPCPAQLKETFLTWGQVSRHYLRRRLHGLTAHAVSRIHMQPHTRLHKATTTCNNHRYCTVPSGERLSS